MPLARAFRVRAPNQSLDEPEAWNRCLQVGGKHADARIGRATKTQAMGIAGLAGFCDAPF